MKKRIPLKAAIALLTGGTIVVAAILEALDRSAVPDHAWHNFINEHEELHN